MGPALVSASALPDAPDSPGQQPRQGPSRDRGASAHRGATYPRHRPRLVLMSPLHLGWGSGCSCNITKPSFSLQTRSRAAVPGRGWAPTRRTANPSRWVSLGICEGGPVAACDTGMTCLASAVCSVLSTSQIPTGSCLNGCASAWTANCSPFKVPQVSAHRPSPLSAPKSLSRSQSPPSVLFLPRKLAIVYVFA